MIKSQSAMEYLMTYGWAILIIAVVLAALFELGVFNPMTFAPKASPGSCQVVRPEGAGTTNFISLSGECNGELPQYVAQFNGNSADVLISNTLQVSTNSFTWSLWIYPKSWQSNNAGVFGEANSGNGYPYMIEQGSPTAPLLQFSNQGGGPSSAYSSIDLGVWQNIVGVYNYTGGVISLYVDGKLVQSSTSSPLARGSGSIYVGYFPSSNLYFNGNIANVQMYDYPLSVNDIQALYQEGIGGAPIKVQNLVGWWPLNGNANDYSGNGNDGVPSGVTYTNSWYSGYSTP
ncbi:MAG: LamG domain-containing protein [Candidatus Micrarchaeaceae archaeon]|jgi:hypothetical protein